MLNFSIRINLLVLLMLSVGGSMLLAGVAISYFVARDHEDKAHTVFEDFYHATKSSLDEISSRMSDSSESLAQQPALVSTVSFISEYMDRENYQPLLFEGEKKKLAQLLSQYAESVLTDQVRIYDDKGLLISFADASDPRYRQGYLDFNNKQPVVKVNDRYKQATWITHPEPFWDGVVQLKKSYTEHKVFFTSDIKGISLVVTRPVNRRFPDGKQRQVGTLVFSKYISYDFLNTIGKEPGFYYAIVMDDKVVAGDKSTDIAGIDYKNVHELYEDKNIDHRMYHQDSGNQHVVAFAVPMENNERFYFLSSLDKTIVNKDVSGKIIIILQVFLLSALVVIPIGLVFSRKSISQPLESLVDYAASIKDGRYHKETDANLSDEFRTLSTTMDEMAETIRRREDELKKSHEVLEERVRERTRDLEVSNTLLQSEIEERKEVETRLIHASIKAETANKAKSEFLSRMSHELRTPLNAILGFAQLLGLSKEETLTEEQQDSVNEIIFAGNHLLELINDVLDLSRIESGGMEIKLEQVNLVSVIQHCLNMVSSMAEDKRINIKTSIDETSAVCVMADELRLKQAVLNLCSNALKFTAEKGEIEIGVEPGNKDGLVAIYVRDNGIGISAKNMKQLFRPFERLGADQLAIDGTGIGLVITRELMLLMNGEIRVESKEGEGSTFWLMLHRCENNNTRPG